MPAVYALAQELEQTNQSELFAIASYSNSFAGNVYDHNGGISYYSGSASSLEADLTDNYTSAVETFDNKYKYSQPVAGGTNIAAGIDEAIDVLTGPNARPNAFKTMIVMTDGQYNAGRAPADAAADAAALGIDVYTVTFGVGANQSAMQLAANSGNGVHFHADNGDSLAEAFKEIANLPPVALIE